MAEIREANRQSGYHFFDTERRGYWGGQRETFHGPYEGSAGVFFVSHKMPSSDAQEAISLECFDPATGTTRTSGRLPAPIKFAIEVAKAHAAGKPLKLAAALRGLGVRDAASKATVWAQEVRRSILDDMRTMTVPLIVRDWSELHDYVDANAYLFGGDFAELSFLGTYADDPDVRVRVLNALVAEVEEWLQSQGHVKALKRLGKDAFRDNPRRRAPARRNRTQRPRPAQHRTQHSTRRSARRRTH